MHSMAVLQNLALLAALATATDGAPPTVALCAPTGKAAARLTEAIGEYTDWVDDPEVRQWLLGLEAQTIHRLLGATWRRGRFEHHARNPLPYDWVIVDEMSMVSLPSSSGSSLIVKLTSRLVPSADPIPKVTLLVSRS